jgi:hypothetical protein
MEQTIKATYNIVILGKSKQTSITLMPESPSIS